MDYMCTMTADGRITVPQPILEILGTTVGDRIVFRIEGDVITVRRAHDDADDPAIAAFLRLIDNEIASGRNVEHIPDDLITAMRFIRAKVDVDLDDDGNAR